MRVAKGKVVGNTVVLEGEILPRGQSLEGSQVTVYLDEGGRTLDEPRTRELLEAIAECDRGEVSDADRVFAALPPRK